jgi:uncharacterized protein (DUF427 family)
MKAMWHGQVIAESDQTTELGGYQYFPPSSVRRKFLHAAPKTAADNRCLQNGTHSSERAAWAYEAPQTSHAHVTHWVGFWSDVELQR